PYTSFTFSSISFLHFYFFSSSFPAHLDLHSFPTRRSSDLNVPVHFLIKLPHLLWYLVIVKMLLSIDLLTVNVHPLAPRKPDKYRSEEHTSELQSRFDLVCRLLLEKKKRQT